MGSWGCPHDLNGNCQKVGQRPCDPGMKGCVLAGRYVFANDETKNKRLHIKNERIPQSVVGIKTRDGSLG